MMCESLDGEMKMAGGSRSNHGRRGRSWLA